MRRAKLVIGAMAVTVAARADPQPIDPAAMPRHVPIAAPPRAPVRAPAPAPAEEGAPSPKAASTPPAPTRPAAPTTTPPPARPHAGPVPPGPKRRRPVAKKPEAPPLPEPSLKLALDTPAADAAWTMRLENMGPVPLEILADARALAFEVALPDEERAIRCELPESMRPRLDDDRTLVVPPGRAYAEKLDPRLYCFGERASKALAEGAKVKPILVGPAAGPPAVAPLESIEPRVATERTWAGDESTIGAPTVPPRIAEKPGGGRVVEVTASAWMSADRGSDVAIAVTVKNVSSLPVKFLFRPDTLVFDVAGPSGVGLTDPSPTRRCAPVRSVIAPVPEALTTLAPHADASLTVMLAALCPDHAIDHPGLYMVRAKLDTRGASGSAIGLRTFDGEAEADAPTHVRVERWPGVQPPMPRPRLAETPVAAPSP